MKYFFEIPCKKDSLKDVRGFVWKALSSHGLSEIDISALVLAIDEVCANLIIHSHNCDHRNFVKLEIRVIKGKGIEFYIYDHGTGFDIANYNEPSIEEIISTRRKGGIGLILVRKIMDKIDFFRNSEQNVCKLFKKADVN